MSTKRDLLSKAAQHVAQARAINDHFAGKGAMPAEAARQMGAHLEKSSQYQREAELAGQEAYLREPQYKHDMTSYGDGFGASGDAWGVDAPGAGLSTKTVRDFAAFVRGTEAGKAALVEDTDGNKLVPADFAGVIVKELSREGVIRGQATIRPTNRRTVDLGSVNIASASWGKLELGDANADGLGNPPAGEDTITVWDLNALVKIGRDEMEDSDEGLVELIRGAVVAKLAEQEDDAFANGAGDGSKQPFGIAKDTSITQGLTATTEATVTADDLMKMPYAVPGWARKNGAYYANSSVEQAAALLKGSDGHYLWQPVQADGRPATWNGHRWYTLDGLPAMNATATPPADKALFFGDMKAGYMIADRRKFTVDVLRERFIDEGKIGLLFTHRVGGSTIRPKALAWLKY